MTAKGLAVLLVAVTEWDKVVFRCITAFRNRYNVRGPQRQPTAFPLSAGCAHTWTLAKGLLSDLGCFSSLKLIRVKLISEHPIGRLKSVEYIYRGHEKTIPILFGICCFHISAPYGLRRTSHVNAA